MRVIRKYIQEFTEGEKREIDNFIELNNGLIFHETKFNEITSITFKTKLSYFLAFQNKALIGICPVHTIHEKNILHNYSNLAQFEIPYGGWVYDNKSSSFYSLRKNMHVGIIEPLIYWSSFLDKIPDDHPITNKKFQTGQINLNTAEDDIFSGIIHSKRRNMIRKAEKSGITIKKYGADGFSIYYSLMLNMHKKAGLTEIPFQHYERVLENYFPMKKAIIMIAFLKTKPVSGLMIIGNQNVKHYWQGASAIEAPNLGQGELLQWEAIKWARAQGASYYDLCVIEPERLPNIARFKMGFTKELVPFYCFTERPFLFKVINKLRNVFTN